MRRADAKIPRPGAQTSLDSGGDLSVPRAAGPEIFRCTVSYRGWAFDHLIVAGLASIWLGALGGDRGGTSLFGPAKGEQRRHSAHARRDEGGPRANPHRRCPCSLDTRLARAALAETTTSALDCPRPSQLGYRCLPRCGAPPERAHLVGATNTVCEVASPALATQHDCIFRLP